MKPVSGGSGGAVEATAQITRLPGTLRREGRIGRMLEDERFLGAVLLAPTVALLLMFIAYPFGKGIWLSLTSTTVGNPGDFVGLKNFAKIWADTIFKQAAYNTFVYTGITTVFKLALGMWL